MQHLIAYHDVLLMHVQPDAHSSFISMRLMSNILAYVVVYVMCIWCTCTSQTMHFLVESHDALLMRIARCTSNAHSTMHYWCTSDAFWIILRIYTSDRKKSWTHLLRCMFEVEYNTTLFSSHVLLICTLSVIRESGPSSSVGRMSNSEAANRRFESLSR